LKEDIMNELQQRLGVILSTCVDLAKGSLGQAFAVTLVCRHRSGPAHILIGDDKAPNVIVALEELERFGTRLLIDGEEQPDAKPATDRMAEMLQESAEFFRAQEASLLSPCPDDISDAGKAAIKESAEEYGARAGKIEALLVELAFVEAPVETVHMPDMRDGE
jgi:hypothetical protein